jgi:ubiquitin-activating enzyme E1
VRPCRKSIDEVIHNVDKKGRKYSRLRLAVPEGMRPGSLRDQTELLFSDVTGLVHGDSGISINEVKTPFQAVQALGDPANTVRIYPSLAEQGYSDYVSGGFVHECKETVVRNFRPFAECLTLPPQVLVTDSMMDGTAEKNVHLVLAALLGYGDVHNGQLPPPLDSAAVDEVFALAQNVQKAGEAALKAAPPAPEQPSADRDPDDENPVPLPPPPPPAPFTVDYFNDDFVKRAAATAAVELQPMCALLGAIVAQEVVKVTGKFTPIYQFLHLNSSSVLPDEAPKDASVQPADRYQPIRVMFGEAFLSKLKDLKMFMVGCGALGCEYIKNFALTGTCCGPNGQLIVTDNDRIEVSNLNRQFLFREDNIGQQKSVAAGNRARMMNKDLKIDARQDFVGETTEHLFDDEFWARLDVVTNALDNMAARLYVDDKCVLFEKILVEAGTMGTSGNVDIIVPHKTTTYAEGGAADDTGGIPMCTLRNFPYIYDHCIEWARAQFEDLFVAPIMMTQLLRENPQVFRQKLHDEVMKQDNAGLKRSLITKNVKNLLALQKVGAILTSTSITMEDCVALAWTTFHAQFRDRIASLINALPSTATKKNGEPFWSGHRKFPPRFRRIYRMPTCATSSLQARTCSRACWACTATNTRPSRTTRSTGGRRSTAATSGSPASFDAWPCRSCCCHPWTTWTRKHRAPRSTRRRMKRWNTSSSACLTASRRSARSCRRSCFRWNSRRMMMTTSTSTSSPPPPTCAPATTRSRPRIARP